jgi:hypothetical protein
MYANSMSPAPAATNLSYSASPSKPVYSDSKHVSGSAGTFGIRSVIEREEILVDPESARKLEEEFFTTRSQLHDSTMRVRDRSREVSDQKLLNSELKNKARLSSPLTTPVKQRVSTTEIEMENDRLESTLRVLQSEIKEAKKQESLSPAPRDEKMLELRIIDEEHTNFLLKFQNTEFEHLKKLLIIFQEENLRLNSLFAQGHRPSDADILYIKDNIRKIREEIDAILNGRAALSLRFQEMQESIQSLTLENQQLKETKTLTVERVVHQSSAPSKEPDLRDRKIKSLQDEIEILRRDLQWAQITKPDAGLVYRLEHENSLLQQELSNIRLSGSLVGPSKHLASTLETTTTSFNLHEKSTMVNTATPTKIQSASKQQTSDMEFGSQPRESTRPGQPVSQKQLEELGEKVREFGECNQELEELIWRLRGKVEGGAEQYYTGSNYATLERKYRSQEGEKFQQMISELKTKVDKICVESSNGNSEATKLIIYLEKILRDSQSTQEFLLTQQQVLRTHQSIADELLLLKQAYQELEIKHAALLDINKQSELHVVKQASQISELREAITTLIQENQAFKIRERDANKEAAEAMRLRLQLSELDQFAALHQNT